MRRAVAGVRGDRFGDERGLSLIEMVVAIFVIAITFTALLSTLLTSFRALQGNEAHVGATALSNELLEELTAAPWERVGLAVDEAPSLTFEGESVVLLPDDAGAPAVTETLVRGGRNYDVERWITWWQDDEVEQDVKRMTVILTWQVGDDTRTMRTQALRAPEADEVADLQVRFTSLVNADLGGTEIGLDADSNNLQSIHAAVQVTDPEASVEIRWTDRNDDPQVRPVVNGEVTIGTGKPFPNGPMSFVVRATGGDGQTASNTGRVTFYHPLEVHEPVVSHADDEEPICTRLDVPREPVSDVLVGVGIDGMTGSDAVTESVILRWNVDDEIVAVPMDFAGRTLDGAAFEATAVGPFEPETEVTFQVLAERETSRPESFDAVDEASLSVPVQEQPAC